MTTWTALAAAALIVATTTACRGRGDRARRVRDAAAERAHDDGGAGPDAPPWPELADLPRVTPTTVIELPVTRGMPLAAVVGPVVIGELAVVGSSQLGFVAIDWRRGVVAWQRETGPHLAPPLAHADGVLLVSECERAPLTAADQLAVGCWRVVAASGADVAAGTLTGDAGAVGEFATARGAEDLFPIDDHRMRWTRGDAAVELDLDTGRVIAGAAAPAAVIARHRGREWRIAIDPDGALVGRDPSGALQWRMTTRFAAVLGVLPGQSYEVPMVRVANLDGAAGRGFVDVLDIDATGSKRGQAGTLVPGIAVIGHAFTAPGDTALAVRLDASLQHDYVAAHDARGALAWVWPLPERPRADPVGLAFGDDGAVLVFHDGDRLTVLPPLSRRSTAPRPDAGSGSGPSQNPTP